MKKLVCFVAPFLFVVLSFNHVSAQGLFNRIKQKVEDKMNQKAENTTGNAMDKVLNPSTGSKNTNTNATTAAPSTGSTNTTDAPAAAAPKTIAVYKNYDFVPGQQIILESQLDEERVGEIPSQFVPEKGQLDVQEENGVHVIHVPKGAGARFYFRVKDAANFPAQLIVEFDEKIRLHPAIGTT